MSNLPTVWDAINASIEQIKKHKMKVHTIYIHPKTYRQIFPISLIEKVYKMIKRNKRLRQKRR